uniref:Putative ovule protein n=1 Tax=Solanum chacoense TaxID=4108 RepID=A0A0V0H899_SOLCH
MTLSDSVYSLVESRLKEYAYLYLPDISTNILCAVVSEDTLHTSEASLTLRSGQPFEQPKSRTRLTEYTPEFTLSKKPHKPAQYQTNCKCVNPKHVEANQ